MNTRHTNLLLWIAAGLLAGGSAIAPVVGWLLPFRDADRRQETLSASARSPAVSTATNLPPLEAFESIWSRPLQAHIQQISATPVTPSSGLSEAVATAHGLPSMVLAGTVGNSLAIIRLADGSTVLKAVGEQVGEARVVAIRPSEVELSLNGQSIRLAKPVVPTLIILPAP